jgi:tricorn protease interacting factor F2/3
MPELNDIHYAVHIEPDLDAFTFTGRLQLSATPNAPVDRLRLNAVDLELAACTARQGETPLATGVSLDPDEELLTVVLTPAADRPFVLTIDYRGTINDRMAGFYRSGYRYEGRTFFMAVTQFQESDARRAFPCFDHPRHKATFAVEMTVDAALTAVSNQTVRDTITLADGRKRVAFDVTPLMSTYLLFFGVGRFEALQDSEDGRVRLLAPPGNARFGRTGLEYGRQSLHFCETYFDIPYPLEKLDLLSIPDFAFGAMENWGAVTFRENLLLDDPDMTSKGGRERIFEVIAHEITHQWFGNLVTPSDWRYLWLNESFATYFGFGIVDHYRPEWSIWSRFILSQTDSALRRDGLRETFPIEIPGGEHLVINTSTAPIIYSKGGSVLRQIHGFIGEEAFQHGLRHYLRRHAYGCAGSPQFWEAFEAASDQPVSDIMRAWVELPGHPMVRVRRQGAQLTLAQERFSYLPGESADCWPIPITLRIFERGGGERRLRELMRAKTLTMDIGDAAAVKINDGQTGFYRTAYEDEDDLAALGALVRSKRLSPEDRWGLQGDLFARVQAGEVAVQTYFAFLDWYVEEEAFLPLMGIDGNLRYAHLLGGESVAAEAALCGSRLAERVLDTIGWLPAGEESHPTAALRDQLLWHAALYGSDPAKEAAGTAFADLMRGVALPPDLLKAALQAGALIYDAEALNWMTDRLERTTSEHERLAIMAALGCFRTSSTLAAARDYVLDHVPDRNRFMPLVAMAGNPYAVEDLWAWFVASQERFTNFHPLLFERVLAALVPVAGLTAAAAAVAFCEGLAESAPQFRSVLALSLEKLEINRRFREG